MDLLDCPVCELILCEPATLSCGHSLCRRCVGYLPSKCPLCKERLKQRDTQNTKNNVLLIGVVEKCYPQETRMRGCIQEKLRANEFTEVLRIAGEAMHLANTLAPEDLSFKLYRAEAHSGLKRYSDALSDLSDLCSLHPNWIEAFLLKGNTLQEMGRHTESLAQFHHCLTIRADFSPAKSQIRKILTAEGVTVPEEQQHILPFLSEYLKEAGCSQGSLNLDGGPGGRGQRTDRRSTGRGSRVMADSGTEGCLNPCPAVSFLPKPDEDDDTLMMGRKDDALGRGCRGKGREKSFSVLSVSDFECPLCIRLFHEPVTTPCGHTFCKNCVKRSLDHNLRCPLCKQPLQEYFEERKFSSTVLLQDIMAHLFPSQLAERKRIDDAELAELSNLTKDIPIFVCTVAYPSVRCPLHIFEPRYRLMMRRCMETGTKKFGMCSYDHSKGFADYGCILEIHALKLLPDGRSFVDALGMSRFRVLKRGQRDGYQTADIEYLEDVKVEGPELDLLQGLHDDVYQESLEWYQGIGEHIRERINAQYGAMPEKEDNIQTSSDGPAWCWWVLSVLQLDSAYQTTILSLPALKDRLGHLRRALEYFSQS